MTETISPYLMDDPPTSTDRVFLPRAFWHWCALHHGLSPEEIADAFQPNPPVATDATEVAMAARLLGEVIARDGIQAWARPLGGGVPVRVPAGAWELDDFRRRFASGAMDPARPFDPGAEPTHWIFLDLEGFNEMVERSLPESERPRAPRDGGPVPGAPVTAPSGRAADGAGGRPERYLRLPEVRLRTGLSRSTIYRRIDQGRFPEGVDLGGNVAAWRESEIDAWVANPT